MSEKATVEHEAKRTSNIQSETYVKIFKIIQSSNIVYSEVIFINSFYEFERLKK